MSSRLTEILKKRRTYMSTHIFGVCLLLTGAGIGYKLNYLCANIVIES